MAGAEKGAIPLRIQLAGPVRADRGKGEQLFALANHEESLVAEMVVYSVGGIVGDRSRIYHPFSTDGGRAAHGLATRGHGDHGQHQELPAVHARTRVLELSHL